MATMNTLKNRALFRVRYKDPYTDSWKAKYYKTKDEAVLAKAHWDKIELLKKNGMDWENELHAHKQALTIGEIFTRFRNNVLTKKTNIDTKAKYNVVMNSVLKVFPEDTIAESIRSMSKAIQGNMVDGWKIYMDTCEYVQGRARRGINSYLRDLKTIFDWALEEGHVSKVIVTKNDRYTISELPEHQYKQWSNEEIDTLFNHPALSEFHKDLIWLYTIMGSRANELTGRNSRKPYKELHWEHVDLEAGTILLLQKRRKTREIVNVHPSVMVILKKWHERGQARPVDMYYSELHRTLRTISDITGIDFTCHDLRRMKAQLLRKQFHSAKIAGHGIGDKSEHVVEDHYAGLSLEEQAEINNGMFEQLTSLTVQA